MAGRAAGTGRLPAREILNLIHHLPRDSALQRKLQGPIVDWTLTDLQLRQTNLLLAGANWQRSGGKGQKPKPVELPDKQKAPRAKPAGDDVAQRLKNLNLLPPDTPI